MHMARAAASVFLFAVVAPSLRAARSGGEYRVTAYCSCPKCCGRWADGLTATGKRAQWGMIAADWRVLPRGTRVRLSCFPGQIFVVEDRGGAIKGKRIDVWHPSHRAALEFGVRRKVQVKILADPPVADATDDTARKETR